MITASKKIMLLGGILLALFAPVSAQEAHIVIEPTEITLNVGDEIQLTATAFDANKAEMPDTVFFFLASRRDRRALGVTRDGVITAFKPGTYEISARTFGEIKLRNDIELTVAFPPITSVELLDMPTRYFAGTKLPLITQITDQSGAIREEEPLSFASSNPNIAFVDDFQQLVLLKKGNVTLTAKAGDVSEKIALKVEENPVAAFDLSHNYEGKNIRTGDVLRFTASAKDTRGRLVPDLPVTYSFIANPTDDLGQGASALMEQDGRFVANHPGTYTVMARSGNTFAESTFIVVPRNVRAPIELVGKGIVPDAKTSDLWIWEGVDGRDYAVTGTWGARGEAFFWDVTDPTNIHTIDTVQVDARTVNDVKVSEDGTIAVITREGASNRKNGIIILDVSDPHNVEILSEYTQNLTGGVHNTFIYENHVYAVNNGRKYDIINIEDPRNPKTVGVVELDTPGHSIHDVWIEDGIAYSSNWADGVVAMDVGSTNSAEMPGAGGSPTEPSYLGSYTYPTGWNHAAFPFKSESTGDFYIAAGDEAFPYGLNMDAPNRAAGWVHFIKFDDWDSPSEVARYQVPEAGSHNYWIEGDILYAAFYNGGLRVVDISGELMGDLYQQGREIAMYLPSDPNGVVPNSTFTWGPQPYKGYIFLSDWNSGIWCLKIADLQADDTH